jgi:hypothetical protein
VRYIVGKAGAGGADAVRLCNMSRSEAAQWNASGRSQCFFQCNESGFVDTVGCSEISDQAGFAKRSGEILSIHAPWVALVDGNNHQIERIKAEARTRKITVSILIDLVHVLEYLWKAVWSFHKEGDPEAEDWVRRQALAVLDGRATRVADSIRRAATRAHLEPSQRGGADTCATYHRYTWTTRGL